MYNDDDIEVICNIAVRYRYRDFAIQEYKLLIDKYGEEHAQYALEMAIKLLRKLEEYDEILTL